MFSSTNTAPIRKISRKACEGCGNWSAFGFRLRGRWTPLPSSRRLLCRRCVRNLSRVIAFERQLEYALAAEPAEAA